MNNRLALATALTINLTACAVPGSGGYWLHQSHSDPAQFNQDFDRCAYEAAAATASAPATFSLSQNLAQDVATGVRRGELQRMCMTSRGYYWNAK